MDREAGPATGPAEPSLHARRAAFIARITAAATHEFRNILAIVKESSGLVDDLVAAAGSGPPDPEKVGWALDRIRLQVKRGGDLSSSLNRVMHGLDQDEETVTLSDAMMHAGLLAQRFACQERCEIRVEAGDADLTVTTNALDLYRGLVAVLEWCVARTEEGGTVVAQPVMWENRPAVRFSMEPEATERGEGESWEQLRRATADLPTEIRWDAAQPILLVFGGLGVT